jgi:hypothetical protein
MLARTFFPPLFQEFTPNYICSDRAEGTKTNGLRYRSQRRKYPLAFTISNVIYRGVYVTGCQIHQFSSVLFSGVYSESSHTRSHTRNHLDSTRVIPGLATEKHGPVPSRTVKFQGLEATADCTYVWQLHVSAELKRRSPLTTMKASGLARNILATARDETYRTAVGWGGSSCWMRSNLRR